MKPAVRTLDWWEWRLTVVLAWGVAVLWVGACTLAWLVPASGMTGRSQLPPCSGDPARDSIIVCRDTTP